MRPQVGYSEAEILKKARGLRVLCPQFEQAHYSNFGIALLGRALQRAVNTTWEEWVAAELLAPLGMRDSGLPPWQVPVGLYPIVTLQYSSTTLYQVFYHIQ